MSVRTTIYAAGLSMLIGSVTLAYGTEDFSPELVAEGEALFEEFGCAGCHGEDVAGGIHFENLSAKYSAAGIIDILAAPQPPMPEFDLTDEEKHALAAFLLSTYP